MSLIPENAWNSPHLYGPNKKKLFFKVATQLKWKKLFEGFYDARMGRISRTKEEMSYDYIKDDWFVAIFMQTSSQTLIS